MEPCELLQMRLGNQLVSAHDSVSPRDVVERLGAMQAQDLLGAKWAVALRAQGELTECDIDAAIADKQLVRSWPMRGTLHFVAPEDLKWMQQVTAERLIAGAASRARGLDLNDTTFAQAGEARAQLSGGRALTRPQMLDLFERSGVSTSGSRGYHLLWHLSQQGLLCFGPMEGKQPTFVLAEEWLPQTPNPTREEAVALFARRYFAGHGPATLKDFVRWTGLTITESRAGLKAIASELESVHIDGTEYWFTAETTATPAEATTHSDCIHLLPGFDEYVIGYADRRLMFGDFHDDYHSQVAKNGMFSPVIVADGVVIGTWKRAIKAREVVISLAFFDELRKEHRSELERAIERYGEYLQLPARVVFEQ